MKKDGCATLFNDDIGKHSQLCTSKNAAFLSIIFRFSTHANGNNLELYDEPLFDALERMKNAGVFENTVLLITGDHGQRINKIKHTYYGKIEERMPLAAIHLPDRFRQFHPKLYDRLVQNTNRFTSTFDLHETLKDLTQLRDTNTNQVVSIDNETKRVGRSLFEEIPINRDCKDAKVPENFCVCMQNLDEGIETKVLQLKVLVQIQNYLNDTFSNLTFFAVTPLVRYGPRYIEEWNKRIEADPSKANVFREIVELEQNVSFWIHPSNNLENKTRVEATFRFQHNRIFNDGLAMLSDAWLRKAPCSIYQIPDLCKCSK
ncbi:hypothetical protein M3Y97_00113000 [Aphelenchoides bicaudatus]|nr:hypothetical protein M3Y97_00113000 [Aphelenchoides bicaudatus]